MATPNLLLPFVSFIFLLTVDLASSQAGVQAGYWYSGSGVLASSIDSTLFTHLFCAFADLDPSSYQVTISSSNVAAFASFTSTVQQTNPSVITLLSIGGGGSTPGNFSKMASQASSRKSFIDSSINLARSNGFLGLDLDWEYPQKTIDMTNMGILFTEWRAAIDADASSSGMDPLLLTAAVSVSSSVDSLAYPIEPISDSLDWVNVMAYDFYAPSRTPTPPTSAHAALFDPSGGASGSAGITSWITAGLASSMLALGLPYYGYAWNLADPAQHGLGAPATGKASGPGIDSEGAITYNQIKVFIQRSGATMVYNSTVVVNYCYSGTTWIGYDDVQSVAAKVAYAKQEGLRGYFAWQVTGDANWALSQQASTTWGSNKNPNENIEAKKLPKYVAM